MRRGKMKRLIIPIALMLVVACLIFGQVKQPTEKTVIQEITALEKAWGVAGQKHDVSWFEQNIADSYSGVVFGSLFVNKAAKVANARDKKYKADASDENMKVQPYGDVAIATGISVIKGTFDGQDISGRYAWTDTWVEIGGRWQCVAEHGSKLPSK
jgi:ketosteroid isomerase-like protein